VSGNPEAWTFDQGITASRRAKEGQEAAEAERRDTSERLASAEMAYRLALAKEITRQHADGVAWTVCQDLARGDERVAALRYERDVARGVLDAAEQRAWRHTADRKDVTEFLQWSRIVAPLGERSESQTMRRAA
jgi:hypothetical protein